MNPFVEALLVLVFLAVIAWRSRELLLPILSILTNPRRLADFLRFFWRGRNSWFGKAQTASEGRRGDAAASPGEPETKRGSQWMELARALGGYTVAMLAAGLYVNDGGNKVIAVILMAVAIVVIPSKWQM